MTASVAAAATTTSSVSVATTAATTATASVASASAATEVSAIVEANGAEGLGVQLALFKARHAAAVALEAVQRVARDRVEERRLLVVGLRNCQA